MTTKISLKAPIVIGKGLPYFLQTLANWQSPLGPLGNFEERLQKRKEWLKQLEEEQVEELFVVLIQTKQELTNLGYANTEDIYYEASTVLGELGQKFPKKVNQILTKLLQKYHIIIPVLEAIAEMRHSDNFSILEYIYEEVELEQAAFIDFIGALGATPGEKASNLLETINAKQTDLEEAVREELRIALANR